MLRLKEWIRPILVLTSGIAVLIGGIELYFKMGVPGPDLKTSPPHPIAVAPHRDSPIDGADTHSSRTPAESKPETSHSNPQHRVGQGVEQKTEHAQNHEDSKSWGPKDLDEPVSKGVKKIKDSVTSLMMKVPLKSAHETAHADHTEATEGHHAEPGAEHPKSHAIEEVVGRTIAQSLYPVAPISSTPLPNPSANASSTGSTLSSRAGAGLASLGFISESELPALFTKQSPNDQCQAFEVRGAGFNESQGSHFSSEDWKKIMDLFHETKDLLRTWLKGTKKELFADSLAQWMTQQLDALVIMRPPSVEEPDLNWRGIGVLAHHDPAHPTIRVSSAFVKTALAHPSRGRFEIARLVAQVWAPCEFARANLTPPWDPILMCLGVPLTLGCASGTYSEAGWAVSTALAAMTSPPGCKIPAFDGPSYEKCLNLYSSLSAGLPSGLNSGLNSGPGSGSHSGANETVTTHPAPAEPHPASSPIWTPASTPSATSKPAHRSHMPAEEKDFEPNKGHH